MLNISPNLMLLPNFEVKFVCTVLIINTQICNIYIIYMYLYFRD